MGKQLAITDNGVFFTGSKAFLTVDGIHRKALKMYRTTGGVHRLCFSGGLDVATMGISYTGNMQDEIVTMSGVQYRLLTLTSSGTLTVDEEVNAEVWMCNGGNAGDSYGAGGGGGYIATATLALPRSTVAVIGSGGKGGEAFTSYTWRGGTTSFGDISPQAQKGLSDGASGGGQFDGTTVGKGIHQTTCPFGDQIYFNYAPHSAGGGGGAYLEIYADSPSGYEGGDGGSNGAEGGYADSWDDFYVEGGQGGTKGGGGGGRAEYDEGYGYPYAYDGDGAYFYGSGGGGGAYADVYDSDGNEVDFSTGDGGDGYQGVIYVRIPLEQTA